MCDASVRSPRLWCFIWKLFQITISITVNTNCTGLLLFFCSNHRSICISRTRTRPYFGHVSESDKIRSRQGKGKRRYAILTEVSEYSSEITRSVLGNVFLCAKSIGFANCVHLFNLVGFVMEHRNTGRDFNCTTTKTVLIKVQNEILIVNPFVNKGVETRAAQKLSYQLISLK
jgi:hypothetical protein